MSKKALLWILALVMVALLLSGTALSRTDIQRVDTRTTGTSFQNTPSTDVNDTTPDGSQDPVDIPTDENNTDEIVPEPIDIKNETDDTSTTTVPPVTDIRDTDETNENVKGDERTDENTDTSSGTRSSYSLKQTDIAQYREDFNLPEEQEIKVSTARTLIERQEEDLTNYLSIARIARTVSEDERETIADELVGMNRDFVSSFAQSREKAEQVEQYLDSTSEPENVQIVVSDDVKKEIFSQDQTIESLFNSLLE